ncbi:cell differentiation protein RCD1 [Cinnamomum micranthum f. kanehirae]|uniref:Cell differentiation protein RCD1 n=1 Tax=Cinnamomum micranthum f. kanehirae TaxID=337451 RepID=A0A443Q2V5_9MAGN|nr:cell differentiation protein RCD1 [Cinnamomum micranthum f. kanehirae]
MGCVCMCMDDCISTRMIVEITSLYCTSVISATTYIQAHLPLYLYPFLKTKDKTPALHQLRFSSLKVIVELIKDDNTEVVSFLLQTEIMPLCLQTVDFGDEATKTAATFILHKILFNDAGLRYICIASDRIFALVCNLWKAVTSPSEPSPRLLKNIIHCCLRLTDDSRASDILKNWLPHLLRDAAFCGCLNIDPANVILFQQFLFKLNRQNHLSTFQAKGT